MADYSLNEINFKEASFNEDTFSNFYEEYYKKIYNYIYFKTGNPCSAEELTCHIIEKILTNMHKYNAAASSLNTWIFTIARNSLVDYFRLRSRSERYFGDSEDLRISDEITERPDWAVIRTEQEDLIHGLLEQLPETEREVMILKFWGGLKNIEIASQLSISSSNINVMVFRTLKRLKKMIEKNGIEL
jgi:RNA polymerase sigma factor (sigma-70 family)